MRRIAKLYGISRTTVKRKLEFLAMQARNSHEQWLQRQNAPFSNIAFDDLETFEHTKCKPLSVTMCVDSKSRKIIGYRVSQIPSKGLLAKISIKKYGPRANESIVKRDELFRDLQTYIHKNAIIESDSNPYYKPVVRRYFPNSNHRAYKGVRGATTGYGELKKIGYDPLFSINHTFAMLRYGICRLLRKTWCTTKKKSALDDHIAIYVDFHNRFLTS